MFTCCLRTHMVRVTPFFQRLQNSNSFMRDIEILTTLFMYDIVVPEIGIYLSPEPV